MNEQGKRLSLFNNPNSNVAAKKNFLEYVSRVAKAEITVRGHYIARRNAIQFIFTSVFGSPAQDTWNSSGIVTMIMQHLVIPVGSHGEVRKMLTDIANGAERKETRGRRPLLLDDGSEQSLLVYEMLG